MDTDDRYERIRRRAHELWEQEGRLEGRADEYWRRAETELGLAADNPLKGDMPEEVRTALEKAILLHTFAVERGKDVGDDITKAIANTRFEVDKHEWTAEKEAAFWICYRKLNSVLSPITIETAKAIRPEVPKHGILRNAFDRFGLNIWRDQSPATAATRWYRWWGVVALVLVLFLQVY